jgi:hypothetical protein
MTTVRIAGMIATFGLVTVLTGCYSQHDVPPTHPVTGQVTLDGKPLESGTILFQPAAPETLGTPPGSGKIVNGRYELQAPLGTNRVSISSLKEATRPDATGARPMEEQVDEKFNVNTELTADVVEGPNTKDFAVTKMVNRPKPKTSGDEEED